MKKLLITLALLLGYIVPAHAQFSRINSITLQDNAGAQEAFYASPFTIKAGAACSWTVVGTVATFNCSGAGIAGTIADTQIAFGTAADTIGGSANLTWDGTSLNINASASAAGIHVTNNGDDSLVISGTHASGTPGNGIALQTLSDDSTAINYSPDGTETLSLLFSPTTGLSVTGSTTALSTTTFNAVAAQATPLVLLDSNGPATPCSLGGMTSNGVLCVSGDDSQAVLGLFEQNSENSIAIYMVNNTGASVGGMYLANDDTLNIFATGATVFGSAIKAPLYTTTTNCLDSAGDAACGAAPAGSVVVDATDTNTVVNTTAVTANSQIFVMFDSSLGTRLSVTCNATVALPSVTARTAGTSFTVTIPAAPVTNPACYSYFIVN